jgi:hypothetical protein
MLVSLILAGLVKIIKVSVLFRGLEQLFVLVNAIVNAYKLFGKWSWTLAVAVVRLTGAEFWSLGVTMKVLGSAWLWLPYTSISTSIDQYIGQSQVFCQVASELCFGNVYFSCNQQVAV